MLVVQAGKTLYKAEADVNSCEKSEDGIWTVNAGNVLWQLVDRRRYPRYAMKLPVKLRFVHETEGAAQITEFEGTTDDLSLGGAWVTTNEDVELGTLIEFQAALSPNEYVRALAVVAHATEQRVGIGIEFLDYVGGARYNLHTFLSKAA
jgi:c-di-GMP-binding flagellar brake protein YcgR